MAKAPAPFQIDDAKSFEENLTLFAADIRQLHPTLGPALEAKLAEIAAGSIARTEVWDLLLKTASPDDAA